MELVKATGGQIKSVNIGGVKKKEGSRQVAANVHMNDDDLTTLRELNSLVYVELRMVPSESKTDVSKLI